MHASLTAQRAPSCGDILCELARARVSLEHRVHLKRMWAYLIRNRGRIAGVPQRTALWHQLRRLGTGQSEISPDSYTCALVITGLPPHATAECVEQTLASVGEITVQTHMFEHYASIYSANQGHDKLKGAWVRVDSLNRTQGQFEDLWCSRTLLQMLGPGMGKDDCANVSVWDAAIWQSLACPSQFKGNMYTKRGTEAEEWIMRDAQRFLDAGGTRALPGVKEGAQIRETGAVYHSTCPFFYASPDGIIVNPDGEITGTLEMKFCGHRRIHYRGNKLVYPLKYAHQRALQGIVCGTENSIFHCDTAVPWWNTHEDIPEDHGVLTPGCNDVRRAGAFVQPPAPQLKLEAGVTEVRDSLHQSHVQLLIQQAAVNFTQKVLVAIQLGVFEETFRIPDESELPVENDFETLMAPCQPAYTKPRNVVLSPGWNSVVVGRGSIQTPDKYTDAIANLYTCDAHGVAHATDGGVRGTQTQTQ